MAVIPNKTIVYTLNEGEVWNVYLVVLLKTRPLKLCDIYTEENSTEIS